MKQPEPVVLFKISIELHHKSDRFQVNLRAVSVFPAEPCVLSSLPVNWRICSRHLEHSQLLDDVDLGTTDARLARGETVLLYLSLSKSDLRELGLERVQDDDVSSRATSKRLRPSFTSLLRAILRRSNALTALAGLSK